MKQALVLIVVVIGALESGRAVLGDAVLMAVANGAMALMALMIAATFLWLWFERATPLALGMVYSWAGAALFIGGGWALALSGQAAWPAFAHVAVLVQGLYLVGALLHFAVIHRSFGFHGASFLWPMALALGLSALLAALV
ncbi:MAG: hypothetical protein AUK37_08105 [Rhodobacterales bacterium CG2_30_65_12]|nr:MAG: hypothetical protein AUK37_08105 [Rhodobacterales bacterium CG2_30_65_12]